MTLVAFVHPFWLLNKFLPWYCSTLDEVRENAVYGSYATYSRNMRHLRTAVQRYAVPSAFILPFEHHGVTRVPWPTRGSTFLPFKDSLVLEWAPSLDGQCTHSLVHQRKADYVIERELSGLDAIASIIAKHSDEVVLCGEMGPYERSATGCVGMVAQALQKKVRVRGIAGCVFPSVPYKIPHVTREMLSPEMRRTTQSELRKTTRLLYDDCPSIDDIVGSRACQR